jgi:hypothetical protein
MFFIPVKRQTMPLPLYSTGVEIKGLFVLLHRFFGTGFFPLCYTTTTATIKSGDVTQFITFIVLLCPTTDNRRLQVMAGVPFLNVIMCRGMGNLE